MVSNLAAIGIAPDFGGCYGNQMLRAFPIKSDLYAISTAGERIAVGLEGIRRLQFTKNVAIQLLQWIRGMARRLPYER